MSEPQTLRSTFEIEAATRPGAILLVDDDKFSRQTIQKLLKRQGHHVVSACDGVKAMEVIESFTPDLILLDYMMPRMDGLELAGLLRQRRDVRLTPIIMITGVMGTEIAVKALDAGVDDFIHKPSSPAELGARVRAHLRSKFLVDQLENLENIIMAITKSVEAKDPYTVGHSERVAHMAVRLGKAMGLDESDLRSLRLGGLLHDVGKLGIPDSILQKPGDLSDEERASLTDHPLVGEEICRSITSLKGLLHIIRHHHEKLDGSGYPDGIGGDEIPMLTRIMTVCDIHDSLTTIRPYRGPLTTEGVVAALREGVESGEVDGDVVERLTGLIEEDKAAAATMASL